MIGCPFGVQWIYMQRNHFFIIYNHRLLHCLHYFLSSSSKRTAAKFSFFNSHLSSFSSQKFATAETFFLFFLKYQFFFNFHSFLLHKTAAIKPFLFYFQENKNCSHGWFFNPSSEHKRKRLVSKLWLYL